MGCSTRCASPSPASSLATVLGVARRRSAGCRATGWCASWPRVYVEIAAQHPAAAHRRLLPTSASCCRCCPAIQDAWEPFGIWPCSPTAGSPCRGSTAARAWRSVALLVVGVVGVVGRWPRGAGPVSDRTGAPARTRPLGAAAFLVAVVVGRLDRCSATRRDRPEIDGRRIGRRDARRPVVLRRARRARRSTRPATSPRSSGGRSRPCPPARARRRDALALSGFQRLWFVVLPQAFRIAIPPLGNQYLNLIKNSSLGAAIGYFELTNVTQIAVANGSPAVPAFTLTLVIYLVLSLSSAARQPGNRRLALVTDDPRSPRRCRRRSVTVALSRRSLAWRGRAATCSASWLDAVVTVVVGALARLRRVPAPALRASSPAGGRSCGATSSSSWSAASRRRPATASPSAVVARGPVGRPGRRARAGPPARAPGRAVAAPDVLAAPAGPRAPVLADRSPSVLLLLVLTDTPGPWLDRAGAVAGAVAGRCRRLASGRCFAGAPRPWSRARARRPSPVAVLVWLTSADAVGWDDWGGFMLNVFIAAAAIVAVLPARRAARPRPPLAAAAAPHGVHRLHRAVPGVAAVRAAAARQRRPRVLRARPTLAPGQVGRVPIIVFTLFTAAYLAEIVRGGLQSRAAGPGGGGEGARAVTGRGSRSSIVLPQALRNVIPAQIGQFISLFKDTALAGVGHRRVRAAQRRRARSPQQPEFAGQGLDVESLAFVGALFWVGSYTHVTREPAARGKTGSGTDDDRHRRPATVFADATEVGRRRDHRARGRRQALRRVPGARRRQPQGRPPGGGGRHRAVRLGQVHDDPLHQPAGAARRGPDRRRRHRAHRRHPQHPGDPPGDGDGVPAVQPVPAPHRARQRHAGAAAGPPHAQGRGRGRWPWSCSQRVRIPEQAQQVPRPAVGRPAAAGRHRPVAGDEAEGDALRRADLGARPRDDQRGPRRDEGPGPRRA